MLVTELFYLTIIHSFIGYLFECLPLSALQVCGVSLTSFKVFKEFWPCSFTTPAVKAIDNSYKVQGLIDRFNESHRNISSGVVITADESISVIRFHTTPKGDLPHYSYIFSKPEPLGTEIKILACSRLGAMLHLEIQKRKEAMKA